MTNINKNIIFIVSAVFALPLCFKIKNAVVATVCLSAIYAFVSIINTSILSIYPMQLKKYGNVASVSGVMDFLTYLGHAMSSAIYGFTIIIFGYGSMYISWVALSIFAFFLICRQLMSAKNINENY